MTTTTDLDSLAARCEYCGFALPPAARTGRPRMYCCDAHKIGAHRNRVFLAERSLDRDRAAAESFVTGPSSASGRGGGGTVMGSPRSHVRTSSLDRDESDSDGVPIEIDDEGYSPSDDATSAWLKEHDGPKDESSRDWENMLGSGRSLAIEYEEDDPDEEDDPFTGYAERDLVNNLGSGYKIVTSVESERPAAERILEEETGYLIEQLRRCTRNGETSNADKAMSVVLNTALYRIRSRGGRPTLQALADALHCTRQTISTRIRNGSPPGSSHAPTSTDAANGLVVRPVTANDLAKLERGRARRLW